MPVPKILWSETDKKKSDDIHRICTHTDIILYYLIFNSDICRLIVILIIP